LAGSCNVFDIGDSGNPRTNTTDPKTGNIRYSQKGGVAEDGVRFDDSHIKLGHELGHAYDIDRGFDTNAYGAGGVKDTEINAVNFENYLRSQNGESRMRLKYSGSYIGGRLGGVTVEYFKTYVAPKKKKAESKSSN